MHACGSVMVLRSELYYNNDYYMALSHKDWELPNSRIWFAEIEIENSLDFPI